jgi:predicted dehydrogenase
VSNLRIAVIGAGMIGRTHIAALGRSDEASLAAIADPTPAAAALAAEHGVPCFPDFATMLDAIAPDGAIVATPNALHVETGLACLARGIVPLIEKPIAETVAAATILVEAAARAGLPLLVGHHRRHNPILERARELVHGGAIGRLTAVTALSLFQKPDGYFDVAWRREPGGGPVLINLIHNIDDMRFIAGEIASVQALTSRAVRGWPVEDTAAVVLGFVDGALGTATLSDAVAAPWAWELTSGENPFFPPAQPENCYLFAGTEGSLAVPRLALWRYPAAKGWQAPLDCTIQPVPPADIYARQLAHFCRVIRRSEAPRIDGADATRTLAAALAVHQAAATGRPVLL